MKRVLSTLALIALVSAIPASAYYHFVYYLPSGNARAKFDLHGASQQDRLVLRFRSRTNVVQR